MPIPAGTKPKTGQWIECESYVFDGIMSKFRTVRTSIDNKQIFKIDDGVVIGRIYRNKKSSQYLIAASLGKYLPSTFMPSKEASIYE